MLAKYFNDTVTLDKKVGVIIPQGLAFSELYTECFCKMFTDMFGGASVQEVNGAYEMENGSVEYDNNKMVYAYYNGMSEKQAEKIALFVEKARHDLNQECIGVELDGKFILVF